MSQIEERFKSLRKKNETALITYITGGDPSPNQTVAIVEAMIEGGADIVELGLPFSDPIADGPTIQKATVRALAEGTTPKNILEIVRKVKSKFSIPIVILSYYNPIFKAGTEFFKQAAACGVNGLAIPDLPVEEADEYKIKAEKSNIDTIFFASPSTSNARLKEIVKYSSGFLYLISLLGVTGERNKIRDETIRLIQKTLPATKNKIPLAVGFGISKPEHVRAVKESGVDGVIAGSVFVNIIEKNLNDKNEMLSKIREKTSELKNATRL